MKPTIQTGLAQTLVQNAKHNNQKHSKQQKKANFQSERGGNMCNDMAQQTNSANVGQTKDNQRYQQFGGPNNKFQNPSQYGNKRPLYQSSSKKSFSSRHYGSGQYDLQTCKQIYKGSSGVDRPEYHPFNNNRQKYQFGNYIDNEEGIKRSDMNNVAAISTIAPQNCTKCMSLCDMNRETYLQCGHRRPVASLAHNSQKSLKLVKGLVNSHPVALLRDMGPSVLSLSEVLVVPEDITNEVIKGRHF